ncbi:flagellar biosynthesis anti-sigma factor FlgM [Ectothiorhodospira marina]|uniref:Negative regulator of flagellin synthesis n=1 Tax=Ectothiorhodospira marina TaxID=1396821 RepID=A0A1H7FFH2_9GAMM|nr:flagellar biosynthesis anti-sigma factor FlgM [Ectothiorhodospira marina]SEK24826.1 anti-sigma-28 factor, FlgM family [Ectothiorhodospira marina]
MSIEVKNLSQPQARGASDSRGTTESARGGKGAGQAPSPADNTADKITLTGAARRLSDLEQTAASQPQVDEKRVAELRQAIQDGSYQVNAQDVAEGLMKSENLF